MLVKLSAPLVSVACRSVVDGDSGTGTSCRGSWPSQADVRAALSDYGSSASMPLFVRASMTGVTLGGISSGAASRSPSDLTASGSGLTSCAALRRPASNPSPSRLYRRPVLFADIRSECHVNVRISW